MAAEEAALLTKSVNYYHAQVSQAVAYGKLSFPMETCFFWLLPNKIPLTDRYEILHVR
jgi:hypothetical protein